MAGLYLFQMADYRITGTSQGWTIATERQGTDDSPFATRAAAVLKARDKLDPRYDQLQVQLRTGCLGTEAEYLAELWDLNVCPTCEGEIRDGIRVGKGKKAHGGFCSLHCFAQYYRRALHARAGLLYPS